MCFILHLASSQPLPHGSWNPDDRHVWVGPAHRDADAVKSHFSLPEVVYIGSDHGCGCGFRSIAYQNGGWPEESMIADGECAPPASSLQNHQELFDLIQPRVARGERIELYGHWDGEERAKTAMREEISVGRLLDSAFWFRQRSLYQINPGVP